MFSVILLLNAVAIISADMITEQFQKRVDPIDVDEPNHFLHTAHIRTGLGRVTHFHYDATKHPNLIAPHYYEGGSKVIACTQSTVTVEVNPSLVADASSWDVGHMFTTHSDHFACPNPHDGTPSTSPAYREVTALTHTDNAAGMKIYILTTKPAAFADFFDTLTMRMHSTHMLHTDKSQIDAHAAAGERRLTQEEQEEFTEQDEETELKETSSSGNKKKTNSIRSLLVNRYDRDTDSDSFEPRRRLSWHRRRRRHKSFIKKAAKWVKKKIIQPAEKTIKALVTGKVDQTWTKDFAMNWNYDKETGSSLKSYPIAGQTACTECYFHAEAGYKVNLEVRKYRLENVLAEVYGDVKLNLAMNNPGPAVDIKKLWTVFSQQLFHVTFMIGPVPITVSLNLDIDLGLHFTVQEIGATPHINAVGQGHIRFGKQYTHAGGWSPVNSHTLDLNFDSAGGTVKADILLYANIVPKLELHHIGSTSVVITPALDVALTLALPKANCDFKPLQEHSPVCQFSEGTDQNCALGITIVPSINVELDMDLDIELFHKSIYKKKFAPMQLLQKTFTISGFPKCLVGSWSKNRERRALLNALSGIGGKIVGDHVTTSATARSLGDTDTGSGIRDPSLVSPRLYLQGRGANTKCNKDCSGNGFCANATSTGYNCLCQQGWTGDACLIPVIEIDEVDGTGVSVVAGGVHPQPAICGHGKVLDVKTSPEAKYLNVCKGRTNQLFCASGNVTEMQMMDDTVRQTLRSYAEGGYSCSSAMAELQCRLTFPAVLALDNQRILPISQDSCVDMFTPCLGSEEAEAICDEASSGSGSQGYAGIATDNSPWATTKLPTLFDSEHVAAEIHTNCTVAPSTLKACPERSGKAVHVNTDIFTNMQDMDDYILKMLKTSESNTTVCLESFRLHLCQSTMPICNEYGNPIKMKWNDCVSMYEACPELGHHVPGKYGMQDMLDDPDPNNITNALEILEYAKAVCTDQTDYFTRANVGNHPVTCGMELEAIPPVAPWHQDISIIGPVCGLAGLLLGVSIMAVVIVLQKKKAESQAGEDENAVGVSMKQYSHKQEESMTNIAFPTSEGTESVNNPMAKASMPTDPKKLAAYLKEESFKAQQTSSE